ncbi:hypothetical protein [Paractinoplanes atraurantiacus]|uniref:Uncharacterized protein n=1 Tax=Paractinoplanes atraurantiacus TaxID=1036182 RepID=A0A285JWV8_9ACTN|nr:hypothetical protein [Actinoplanes atraurantiacus]SNY64799.1 hypothetical protein SAMN05421748_12752 [Actinoplanes atraurantiacus]
MTDDDLRALLRRADPARDLPASPQRFPLEDIMTTATPAPPAPRKKIALAAAALVLVAAGIGWLTLRPEETTPTVTTQELRTVQLTAPGVQAKCVEPTAEVLAERADFAFAGTVTAVEGATVTLDVTRVYRGDAAGQVRIAQAGDSSEQMMGSGKFENGKKYLVASSQGSMLICGYSGEADAEGLQGLYDRAFA